MPRTCHVGAGSGGSGHGVNGIYWNSPSVVFRIGICDLGKSKYDDRFLAFASAPAFPHRAPIGVRLPAAVESEKSRRDEARRTTQRARCDVRALIFAALSGLSGYWIKLKASLVARLHGRPGQAFRKRFSLSRHDGQQRCSTRRLLYAAATMGADWQIDTRPGRGNRRLAYLSTWASGERGHLRRTPPAHSNGHQHPAHDEDEVGAANMARALWGVLWRPRPHSAAPD
ncbi:hypothetical protein K458DRAFT_94033 [Lentithecium fluviatile CBS 122367]|uniref:Uncharacterized protein n=1 Tax=Lentithecium fluviatile CBS 122367 TaxID=1168545 RepID=A0A6G1IQB6_9PLEO|nr:hypothetical protein K458DRAFT_94033 [Lentithecium fluviatile CBS 122367]